MTVVRTSVGRDTLHLVVSVLVEVCLQGGEVLVDVMLAPTKEEFCGGNFFLGRLRGGAGRVAWGLRLYFDAAASILVRNHLLRLRHVRLRCLAVDLRSSFLRVRSEDGCPECRPVVGVAICDQSYCSLRVSLSDVCIFGGHPGSRIELALVDDDRSVNSVTQLPNEWPGDLHVWLEGQVLQFVVV